MDIELLIFTSKTCGPCNMFKPIVEEVSKQFDNVELSIVDVDTNPDLAAGYGIRSVPYIVLKKDHATYKHQGALGRYDLYTFIEDRINDN